MTQTDETVQCDVLIIGCGGAGLRAAISAAENGCRTWVVSKGAPGKGTCTFFSAGVMAGSHDPAGADDYVQQTGRAGRGINQPDLVRTMAEEGPERHEEMIRWGLAARRREGHLYAAGRAPVWGAEIIRLLMRRARSAGVRFMDGLTACHLERAGDRLAAIALSHRDDRWVGIVSGAVVLATGGAAALFQRHDNPRGMLGQGALLALNAGAVLQDLEFVQFFPLGLNLPGKPAYVIPPGIADQGRLINEKGEDLLAKYGIEDRPAASLARDRLSQALFAELAGRDGGVWLDLAGLPGSAWQCDPFSADMETLLKKRCGAGERPLPVAPMAHHTMGGILIDADGGTGVPGLFAAGEVTGGLHGANRMGGNALTETLVFGHRAGTAAAHHASALAPGREDQPQVPRALAQKAAGSGSAPSGRSELEKLQQVLWHGCGIVRDADRLDQARNDLSRLRAEWDNMPGGRGRLAVENALQMADLTVRAARRRKESRGAHFRSDFPDQVDPDWKGHLRWRRSDGEEARCTFEAA